MKFLIAGLGSAGRRHLRNLRALGEQDIVLLRSHRATLPDEELAGLPVERSIAAALARRPDAVIVATPSALHLEIALAAARAGCHLLIEKPLAHDRTGIDELIAAVDASGARVQVGFQFRFHPTLRRAADLLRAGTLGRVLSAHAHWGEHLPDWHPWEDYRQSYAARADLGGGVLLTLCHPFDYLRWLVGEVAAVWSFCAHVSPLELNVEDVAEVGLRFASGAIGGVHLNYGQRPAVHRLEIVGTAGTLRWSFPDGVLEIARAAAPFGEPAGTPRDAEIERHAPVADFDRNVMFLDQMRAFVDVVRGTAPSPCTLADGVRALDIALAARRAANDGRACHL